MSLTTISTSDISKTEFRFCFELLQFQVNVKMIAL